MVNGKIPVSLRRLGGGRGAPSVTYFCSNGHLVRFVLHQGQADEPTECPYCRSRDINGEIGWGQEGYGTLVPPEPIRHETYEVFVPIYDTSSLFTK